MKNIIYTVSAKFSWVKSMWKISSFAGPTRLKNVCFHPIRTPQTSSHLLAKKRWHLIIGCIGKGDVLSSTCIFFWYQKYHNEEYII